MQKGHYKMSPIWGFSTQQNSTKIGVRVGFADVIKHTKFAIQSYGGSHFGLPHRNGLLPMTLLQDCATGDYSCN